jgi:hypothetical protein
MKINESKSRIELFFMVVWFLTMGIEISEKGGRTVDEGGRGEILN